MAKILVTGGGGLIGSRVAKLLIEQGHEVRVFDIVKTPTPGAYSMYNGSVLDPYEVSVAARGCEYVLHLAAALGVNRTETNRLECLYLNIQGTVNVLEACVKEGVQKILFTSSSEVYGDQDHCPITETAPLRPKSNYAISKLVGEEYLRAYHESYRLPYTIVRLFNMYGEGQSPQFVIPRFVQAVLRDEPPVVYGTGDQVRAFCYVEDAAQGIVAALLSDRSNLEIFNIGNDEEPVTIRELADTVIALSGKRLEPRVVPIEESDRSASREIVKRIPSIAKARAQLGFQPQISLEEGLARMLRTSPPPSPKQPALARAV